MATLLDIRPLDPEPLPLYSREDPDTMSIRSAAPSYVSDTPTYNSHRTPTSLLPPLSPGQQTIGLPAPRFAPGFENRGTGSISEQNFNIGRSNNSKQYSAVVRRRADLARANTEAILNSLSAVPPSPERSETGNSPTSSSADIEAYPVQIESINPLEDPYLVGEEAAGRARRSRVYREMCMRGEETARHESRSWDFMFGQMSDWDERNKSWNNFRSNVKRSKGMGLGRRLGWRS
ncbi:hypothetical protein N0V90_009613 [Kalmusia sp. IMI 367209]|nr:hypothetical protein N0V90_009613 [Kalmusia sp. IMI 367209]